MIHIHSIIAGLTVFWGYIVFGLLLNFYFYYNRAKKDDFEFVKQKP